MNQVMTNQKHNYESQNDQVEQGLTTQKSVQVIKQQLL